MRKAKDLRSWLAGKLPGLADDPDRLQLFVDKGSVRCGATATLNYQLSYTVSIVLTPFAGDLRDVVVPLLVWIATNQPDLLAGIDPRPFEIEAELLDGDQVDLSIALALSERVLVEALDTGGYRAEPLPEPQFPDVFFDEAQQPIAARLAAIVLDQDALPVRLSPVVPTSLLADPNGPVDHYRMWLAIVHRGRIDDVDRSELLNGADPTVESAARWQKLAPIRPGDVTAAAIAAALGLDDAGMDALFAQARTIV